MGSQLLRIKLCGAAGGARITPSGGPISSGSGRRGSRALGDGAGAGRQPPLHKNGAVHHRVERGSGSGDGGTSDSLRNLFVPQSQSDGRKSKDHGSLAAFLHPFADAGKRMSRRSAKHPFLWRKNERAVGDAHPYGGIDESAPVFEGAPMRAVGDAGPYGGCGHQGAVKRRRQPET